MLIQCIMAVYILVVNVLNVTPMMYECHRWDGYETRLTELLLLYLTGSRLPSSRADWPVWRCNISIGQQWWRSRRPRLPGRTACTRWHRGREERPTQRGVHLHRQKNCLVYRKPHMGRQLMKHDTAIKVNIPVWIYDTCCLLSRSGRPMRTWQKQSGQ